HFEEHGDNLAPGLLGGLVVTCLVPQSNGANGLITIKRDWPEQVKAVLLIPEFEMETKRMREALPSNVARSDAIFNIQRAALLQAAISEGRFDLFSAALPHPLHQPYRAPLAPGLGELLKLNDETRRYRGLLGVALSGAGSAVIAFATENCSEIAAVMNERISSAGVRARTLEVEVDNVGRTVSTA